ncbi:hypothetical protein FRC01_013744 [Tulasnella sp. 417]|nr:hypothetical protein FRC01_013744 [Tulasnella sp. 417]
MASAPAMKGSTESFVLPQSDSSTEKLLDRSSATSSLPKAEAGFSDFHDSAVASGSAATTTLETVKPSCNRKSESRVFRRKNLKQEEKGEYESFLDHLADSTSDVELIKDQLLNILLAARDTTAQLLSWTCYVLALHPDIMPRLREEVLATYGDSESPTFENIKGLKYLRAVLDEVLRLFPPVPINVRSPFHDATVVPTRQGPLYFSSAGMLCNWSVPSIHKHKALWGDDAGKFDPDRWIDPARARKVVENPFMFFGSA